MDRSLGGTEFLIWDCPKITYQDTYDKYTHSFSPTKADYVLT